MLFSDFAVFSSSSSIEQSLSVIMRAPQSLKQEFLKKWMVGLQLCESTTQNMSILERKKAIKLSADIAMASTRNGMTCWSRALVAKASTDFGNKVLVENILLASQSEKLKNKRTIVRRKKILRKSHRASKARGGRVVARSLAKQMVKKRTQVLKSLVPGGEFMDDISLIEETLDYIVSLRAQVDVMHTLAKVTELMNGK